MKTTPFSISLACMLGSAVVACTMHSSSNDNPIPNVGCTQCGPIDAGVGDAKAAGPTFTDIGGTNVNKLAVAGGYVYFTDYPRLFRLPVTGGTSDKLYEGANDANSYLSAVAATSTALLIGTQSAVIACESTSSCSAGKSLDNAGAAAVAIAGTDAYWLTFGGALKTCPLAGCNGAAKVIVDRANPQDPTYAAMTADDEGVYVAFAEQSTGAIAMVTSNGTLTMLSDKRPHGGIAVDADNVYWGSAPDVSDTGALYACAKSGCASGPTALANVRADQILVDANNLYFRGAMSAIYACPKTGCTAGLFTLDKRGTVGAGFGQDEDALYYTAPSLVRATK